MLLLPAYVQNEFTLSSVERATIAASTLNSIIKDQNMVFGVNRTLKDYAETTLKHLRKRVDDFIVTSQKESFPAKVTVCQKTHQMSGLKSGEFVRVNLSFVQVKTILAYELIDHVLKMDPEFERLLSHETRIYKIRSETSRESVYLEWEDQEGEEWAIDVPIENFDLAIAALYTLAAILTTDENLTTLHDDLNYLLQAKP